MKPIILINFKLYEEAYADKALAVAKKMALVKDNKYELVVCPSLLTIKEVAQKVKINVFSQHCDHIGLGAHTGKISAQELKAIGVKGTLLNHSERKVPFPYLKEIVQKCKENKLRTVVCASSISEIKKICQLTPDYIAYEPKELIGGDVSVTKSKPDIVVKAVKVVEKLSPRTKLLCGAGIHSKEDLGQALLLGTHGVLIGHAATQAKDPKKFLEEMML